MAELRRFPVFSSVGRIGDLLAHSRFLDDRPEKILRLEDGTEKKVPSDALEIRADGSFYLKQPDVLAPQTAHENVPQPKNSLKDSIEMQQKLPPATPESFQASSEDAPNALNQSVVSRTARDTRDNPSPSSLPSGALFENGYSVETVRVDRIVNEPPEQRHEGDTLILPVLEEVWVYEKKLMLREEIRITPRKTRVENIRAIEKH